MLSYCNEAIDECESEIHTTYEDYFLSKTTISLVAGQDLYSLPTDIYASKIRGIIYQENDLIYPVRRFREMDKFEKILFTQNKNPATSYNYILLNTSAAAGIKLQLIPTARSNLTDGLHIWYIRNANRMVDDTSICDIPEFASFVLQWMKMRCYEKDGDQRYQGAAALMEQQRRQMIDTLTNMVPDGDNELEMDTTFYEDMGIRQLL
jgi:hypothetical protein